MKACLYSVPMDVLPISKAAAIHAYGGNAAALARALGITPAAVYQWPDGPIGEVHSLKLRFVLKPGAIPATLEEQRDWVAGAAQDVEAVQGGQDEGQGGSVHASDAALQARPAA